MNTIKRYLLSVLFLCVSLSAFSQASVYPIDLSAVMLPPYTNCLGDYFSNGRVQLKAIVKDMSRYGKDATLEYSISVKVKRGNTVVLSSIAPLKRKFSETQIINDIPVKELFSDRNNYTGTASGSFFGNGYCLEEGSYEFEYQLFDKNKGNMPLSEPFSVYCYLTQAEPPVGVFPEDGKCYDPSEIPQTMLFQWIDPIAIGPQTRSYELHIKEDGTDMAFTGNMFPKQEAPSSMELYNQSVFNNNFVLINNSASKFREGHKYYWYVQMRGGAADGTNNNAYKNGGKSQTYSFSIGNCNQEEPKTEFDDTKAKNSIKSKVRIELDSAKVVGGAVKTMWELKSNKNDELICGFKVYCYKVDGGNSDEASEALSKTLICGKYKAGDTWTEKLNSSVFEEGVEYFCFVRPVLQNGELGLMSNELSFKIESAKATASPSDDDDCIVELTPRSCVGDSLLTSVPKFFFANDAHQVISVDVNETKMEGQTFTGSGIVTPAWLKNIVPDILPLAGLNVEFEKIKINTDGYLCEGEIKVVSDPDNNLYFDLNELVDFNAGATVASKQKEVFTKEVEKEEDIKGDEYKGEVVRVKSTGDLFAVSMADGELQKAKVGTCLDKNDYCPVQYRGALNSKGISLRFDVDTTFNKDTYSPYIDKNANPFTAQNILDGYVSSGSDYIQPWISMVQGEYKWIKAYFEGTPDVDPNNVEFYLLSKNSLALLEKEYVADDNYYKVKIYGGQPSKSLQIVARSNAKKTDCSKKDDSSDADSNASDDNSTNASSNADSSDGGDSDKEDDSKGSGDKTCEECGDDCVTYGSAQIYMLSSKKVKVMLVPVVQSATDNSLNIDDLKTKVTAANEIINKRFAPLGREFELVVDDAYEYADIPDEGFNVSEDNSEWTKETDEMKALRKAYGLKVGKRDEYQACLFLLTQAKKDGLQGYMPRSNSVGFIFLGNNFENVQSDIMAHELCHGLYGLQHTFAYPGAEQGALHENLMDYVDHNDERYLSKYFQWNNMERFNGHVFKLLDDVEDGEASINPWFNLMESVAQEVVEISVEAFNNGKTEAIEIYQYALCDDNDKTFSLSKFIDRGKGVATKMVDNAVGGIEVVSMLVNAGSTIKSAAVDCDPTSSDYYDCICNGGGASLLLGAVKALGGAVLKNTSKSTAPKGDGSNGSGSDSNKGGNSSGSDNNSNKSDGNSDQSKGGASNKKSDGNEFTESEKSIALAPVNLLVNTGVDQLFAFFGFKNDNAKEYIKTAVNGVVNSSSDAVIEKAICDGLKYLVGEKPSYQETEYYLSANIVTDKGEKYLIIEMNCDYDDFENEVEKITIANKTDNGVNLIECLKDTKLRDERNSLKQNRDLIVPENETFTGGFKYINLYSNSFPSTTPENQLVLTQVDALLENDSKKNYINGGTYSQYELTDFVRYKYKMKLQSDDIKLGYVSIKARYNKIPVSGGTYYNYLSHPLFTDKKSDVKTEYDKTNSAIEEISGTIVSTNVKVATDENLYYGGEPYPSPNRESELESETPINEKNKKKNKDKKTNDTPVTQSITLAKEDMLAIYTKYCCWYLEKAPQYTSGCDKKRQQEASCFLNQNASKIILARKANLQTGNHMRTLFNSLSAQYTTDELSVQRTLNYTDEYDLVKQIYDEISGELKDMDANLATYNTGNKVLNVNQANQNFFNAFFVSVVVQYTPAQKQEAQLGLAWLTYLDLPLMDKSYCSEKNVSCSDKSQNNNNGNGAGNNEGSTAGK